MSARYLHSRVAKDMLANSPMIFSRITQQPSLDRLPRACALLLSLTCFTVLCIALRIRPDPSGVGTHSALGMAPCQFLARTKIPCPSCGMTTSFSHFVRGNVLASIHVQPMGTLLAIGAGLTFWGGLYVAVTGRPMHRLLRRFPATWYILLPAGLAVLAWAWKIGIHTSGSDGWQ